MSEIFWNRPFAVKGIQSVQQMTDAQDLLNADNLDQYQNVLDVKLSEHADKDGKTQIEAVITQEIDHIKPQVGRGMSMYEWNIEYVGAPLVYNITTGKGMIFASADTGVDWTHPVLRTNYLGVKYSR